MGAEYLEHAGSVEQLNRNRAGRTIRHIRNIAQMVSRKKSHALHQALHNDFDGAFALASPIDFLAVTKELSRKLLISFARQPNRRVLSVRTQPGHIEFNAIPYSFSASASMIVMPLSASLEKQ
jgi:hypothetical protein